jgi:hypothetical protein
MGKVQKRRNFAGIEPYDYDAVGASRFNYGTFNQIIAGGNVVWSE